MTNSLEQHSKHSVNINYTSTTPQDHLTESDLTKIDEFLNTEEYAHSNLKTIPTKTLEAYTNNVKSVANLPSFKRNK